jgi:hypothetical protein
MKIAARILLAPFSIFLAYSAGLYAERFTLAPLPSGHFEGTPATIIVFLGVFFLVLIVVLVVGNLLLSRYFKSKNLS